MRFELEFIRLFWLGAEKALVFDGLPPTMVGLLLVLVLAVMLLFGVMAVVPGLMVLVLLLMAVPLFGLFGVAIVFGVSARDNGRPGLSCCS